MSKKQSQRFIAKARELGTDESEAAFDGALRKLAKPGRKPRTRPKRKRSQR